MAPKSYYILMWCRSSIFIFTISGYDYILFYDSTKAFSIFWLCCCCIILRYKFNVAMSWPNFFFIHSFPLPILVCAWPSNKIWKKSINIYRLNRSTLSSSLYSPRMTWRMDTSNKPFGTNRHISSAYKHKIWFLSFINHTTHKLHMRDAKTFYENDLSLSFCFWLNEKKGAIHIHLLS